MAVAAEPEPPGADLAGARELARDANVIPVTYRFVDDCETPVSAFLKLRDAFPGPAFLLESAEQGRLGRYSFLGFKPRVELRWSDGKLTSTSSGRSWSATLADPYGAVAEELGRFEIATPERRRRSRAGPSASSATTWSARSSRWASRTRTRSGCPTWR